MFNAIKEIIKNAGVSRLLPAQHKNYNKTRVSYNSYWAKHATKYGYTLVKADASKVLDKMQVSMLKLEPSVGHNPRREALLKRRLVV